MTPIQIAEGKPGKAEPMVHFWLDIRGDSVSLVAKHSDDAAEQRVVQIELVDGKLTMFQQPLAARHLCDAFGIPQKTRPRIFRWRDRLVQKFSSGAFRALAAQIGGAA